MSTHLPHINNDSKENRLNARQQAFKDMVKELNKEGKCLIVVSLKQLKEFNESLNIQELY